jgi:hypothetical protein
MLRLRLPQGRLLVLLSVGELVCLFVLSCFTPQNRMNLSFVAFGPWL